MWFIGVKVEQETSAPPPKKNPGSAPDGWSIQDVFFWAHENLNVVTAYKDNLFFFLFNFSKVRDYLESRLKETFEDNIQFNGKFDTSERIPNTCNVSFLGRGLEGRKILAAVKKLQASVGAACHSDAVSRPSPILTAIGIPYDIAMNALRLSVGRYTSKNDIDVILEDLEIVVKTLKKEYITV